MTSQPKAPEAKRTPQRAVPQTRTGSTTEMPDGPMPSPKWLALLEEYRNERDELRRRMQQIPQVRQDASVQLAELQKALLSIRQARDSLLGQVHSLSQNKDRNEVRIDELMQEVEE